MTARVAYSRRAAAEAEEITASLAEHSRAAAQRFTDSLGRAELQLAQFPNSGAPGPLSGTRRLIVGDYVVSYRRRGSDVEIFAVRHTRRGATPGPIIS
jgi:plasmid stabilization system protein ParE